MSAASSQELRELIRRSGHGALSSHRFGEKHGLEGYPQGSLVLIAADMDAAPLLLISTLADHTKNLAEDSRCSLLLVPEAGADSQRLTLFGKARKLDDRTAAGRRYIARHPDAAIYAGFGDFAYYRIDVEAGYWVGGFGKQRWLGGNDLCPPQADALVAAETDIIDHMNEDHVDAMNAMADHHRFGTGPWTMAGIDAEGFDLTSPEAGWRRISFESPIKDAGEARAVLVALTKSARSSKI